MLMTNSNNVLIICRDLDSVRKLARFQRQPQKHYVLASDDPRVHEIAKEYSWICAINWIEKIESC